MILSSAIYLEELNAVRAQSAGWRPFSPSPLPAPAGRGRILLRCSASRSSVVTRRQAAIEKFSDACLFSRWAEKGRGENVFPKQQ